VRDTEVPVETLAAHSDVPATSGSLPDDVLGADSKPGPATDVAGQQQPGDVGATFSRGPGQERAPVTPPSASLLDDLPPELHGTRPRPARTASPPSPAARYFAWEPSGSVWEPSGSRASVPANSKGAAQNAQAGRQLPTLQPQPACTDGHNDTPAAAPASREESQAGASSTHESSSMHSRGSPHKRHCGLGRGQGTADDPVFLSSDSESDRDHVRLLAPILPCFLYRKSCLDHAHLCSGVAQLCHQTACVFAWVQKPCWNAGSAASAWS
jgi:hypothetical protein